jgi:ribosomal protein L2
MLLPQTVKVGDDLLVSKDAPQKPGNRTPLKSIQVGTFVYNVEVKPMGGAKLARSAGNYAEVIAHDAGYAHIKMPSSEVRKILETAWASIGQVSNEEHHLVFLGKAGRNRWKGISTRWWRRTTRTRTTTSNLFAESQQERDEVTKPKKYSNYLLSEDERLEKIK